MQPKSRNTKFTIPGIYHPIEVYVVSRTYLTRKYKTLEGKRSLGGDEELLGFYNKEINKIYIAKELAPARRFHTFMHEVVHAIEAETAHLDEEAKCDLVGSYLSNLFTNEKVRESISKIIEEKKLR
jgi:hypothetical protein